MYTDFQNFYCHIIVEILYTYIIKILRLTLSMFLHYLVKPAADLNGILHVNVRLDRPDDSANVQMVDVLADVVRAEQYMVAAGCWISSRLVTICRCRPSTSWMLVCPTIVCYTGR